MTQGVKRQAGESLANSQSLLNRHINKFQLINGISNLSLKGLCTAISH